MFRIYSSIAMSLNIFMRVRIHINFVEFKVKLMKFSVTSTQINLEQSRLMGKIFSTFLKFNNYSFYIIGIHNWLITLFYVTQAYLGQFMGICTICFPYSVFYLGTISSVAESKKDISGNTIKNTGKMN